MAPAQRNEDLTRLLQNGVAGELFELVYNELRAIAQRALADERAGHTLCATELVHEAYTRLARPGAPAFANRAHFYFAASEAIRRILVDHARRRAADKRPPAAARLPLASIAQLAADGHAEQIVSFDHAFLRLEEEMPLAAAVVRLRFFAGLSVAQTAAALGLSDRTVNREWAYARARLFRLMAADP